MQDFLQSRQAFTTHRRRRYIYASDEIVLNISLDILGEVLGRQSRNWNTMHSSTDQISPISANYLFDARATPSGLKNCAARPIPSALPGRLLPAIVLTSPMSPPGC